MELDRIDTVNLIGTRIQEDDLALLYRMYTNDEVMYTLGGTRLFRETKEHHQKLMDHWDKHGYGIYIFRERHSGEFVGRGGLKKVIIEGKEETEIIYALMPPYWGKGLANEMAQKAIEIAFEHLNLPNIVAFTSAENKNSQKVILKAGFTFEKNFTFSNTPHVLYRRQK